MTSPTPPSLPTAATTLDPALSALLLDEDTPGSLAALLERLEALAPAEAEAAAALTLVASWSAGEERSLAALRGMLARWPAWARFSDPETGITPLHAAVAQGRVEVVLLLVATGADPTQPDAGGHTPLDEAMVQVGQPVTQEALMVAMLAAPHVDLAVVSRCFMRAVESELPLLGVARALLARGANPGLQKHPSISTGDSAPMLLTPLALAGLSLEGNAGALALADLLLGMPEGRAHLDTGWEHHAGFGSPLHCAATGGHASFARRLLAEGATPNPPADLADPHPTTPLLRAAMAGEPATVRALLEAGADPHARTADGRGVLHHLAAADLFGDEDTGACLALLLAAGCDPVAPDLEGRTPLEVARTWGHASVQAGLELVEAALRAAQLENAFPAMPRRAGGRL